MKTQGARGVTRSKVEKLLQDSPGITIQAIAAKLGMAYSSAHYHLQQIKKEKRKKNVTIKHRKSSPVYNGQGFTEIDIQAARITGRLEEIVRGYAQSYGVSFSTLAQRVAEGLHAIARG